MKLFGHPIHLMFIHFPAAFFPMDFVCSLIYRYTGVQSFADASFYAMSGGAMLGWIAVIFGTFDLLTVLEKQPDVMKKALLHGGINIVVIMVYSVLAYAQYKQVSWFQPDGIVVLIVKAFTIAFMIVGNFIGGSLILKHRVAVENG